MIELQNVAISAGNFQIRNLSFRIESGEFAIIMGRTGGGKTTILESICGLRKVVSGKILLDQTDVTFWPPGDRGIGYVPQDLALFPNLNVAEHLEFALRLRNTAARARDQRVTELGELLGITHLLSRSTFGLSGGESQRVALGRAISFKPRALVLDEPFSALDEVTRREMHQLLRKVTSEAGITTIHVTHSEEEAVALADRRFVLQDAVLTEVTRNQEGKTDADDSPV